MAELDTRDAIVVNAASYSALCIFCAGEKKQGRNQSRDYQCKSSLDGRNCYIGICPYASPELSFNMV
jgi:hypothetical protein